MTIVLFLGVVIIFNQGVNTLTTTSEREAIDAVRTAVTRAAVQFYALEGRFPPQLSYLEERFGLQLDHDRFIIHYNAVGSNITPQIAVIPRDF